MSAYGYRYKQLTGDRTIVSPGDTITISLSLDTITTNGLVLAPTSITFTAVTTGIFSNIPATNIEWKNGSTVLGTGTTYTLNSVNYGFNALANSGSYTITATATLNPAAIPVISKQATKTITLALNTISASISPATASYTTDAAGNGTANITLTMNIQLGVDSVATGWTYAWSGATFSSGTTLQTATISSISGDTATISCLAQKSGYSVTRTAVISKSKTGGPGAGGNSSKLIYAKALTPFTEALGTTTDPIIPVGWAETVAAASGTGLVYVCTGNKPSNSTTWTWNVPVVMQGQNGLNGLNGADAKSVEISGTDIVFVRPKNGGSVTPSSIILTANCKNFTPNTANSFAWTKNGLAIGTTVKDLTVYPASLIGNDTYKVFVNLDITLLDQTTIPTLREGDDSYSALLVNENQTINANSLGVVVTTTVTSKMWVARGLDVLSSGVSYSCTLPGVITSGGDISFEINSTNMPSGTEVLNITFTATISGGPTINKVLTLSKAKAGATGANGTNGKKTATGYVYWTGLAGSQGSPVSGTYTFATGAILGMSNSWSQTISFNASASNYACYFSVEELSAGSGSGSVSFGLVTLHTNFSGLVSFTDIAASSGATIIHGSRISTGTLTLDRLAALTTTVSSYGDFAFGQSTTVDGIAVLGKFVGTGAVAGLAAQAVGTVALGATTSLLSHFAGLFSNTNGTSSWLLQYVTAGAAMGKSDCAIFAQRRYAGIPIGDFNSPDGYTIAYARIAGEGTAWSGASLGTAGVHGHLNSYGGLLGTLVSDYGGYFLGGRGGAFIMPYASYYSTYGLYITNSTAYGGSFTHSIYAAGLTYPFTGLHHIVIHSDDMGVPGDIVLDTGDILIKHSILDVTTFGKVLTLPNQKGIIGIIEGSIILTVENIHTAMCDKTKILLPGTAQDQTEKDLFILYYESTEPYATALNGEHYIVGINALGEGQINVCGENGNLEVGDLIVTSSLQGKGMKQADDIVRSYTVAKCRENVTFSSPTEVKMVACIYLCG